MSHHCISHTYKNLNYLRDKNKALCLDELIADKDGYAMCKIHGYKFNGDGIERKIKLKGHGEHEQG